MDETRKRSQMPAAIAEPETAIDVERAFEAWHAMVFRTAYRVTGNAGDAEDVLQTVFLRLVRRPGDAEAVGNLAGYLHRAAVNAGLDLLRGRHAAPGISLDALAPPASTAPAPDRLLASGEIRGWLRAAVARLSPQASEIFALRFFEGLENPEIARLVGTTEGTVAVTVSRTRDRIQKEYEAFLGGNHAPRKH
jgi:RNA polymerase sigma-70 factor, ECF subfamily